jgi:DNA-directed RNA polymerase specialized sigma24 family protein
MYQLEPTSEPIFLALCGVFDGVLCNLAGQYKSKTADVLFALMLASKRPLVNEVEEAEQEIAGRIKGLLQEQNSKEIRRAETLDEYIQSGLYPTEAKPVFETRRDVVRAVGRLKAKSRELVLATEVEGYTSQEIAEKKGKTKDAVDKARQRAKKQLKQELKKE